MISRRLFLTSGGAATALGAWTLARQGLAAQTPPPPSDHNRLCVIEDRLGINNPWCDPPTTTTTTLPPTTSTSTTTTTLPPPTGRFPGDPGVGRYYVGWCEDDFSGAPQNFEIGQGWTPKPLSVWNSYSTASNARVQAADLDYAINHGAIAAQSFKLSTWTPAQIVAGSADAAIDDSANMCLARAPHPIWLCYYHEPEDNFTTATTATSYRAAYRRIVSRFRARGVTNVAWQPIYMCPWTFDGSGRDWRWWHPDWTGSGNTWHDDEMMDLLGLDTYNPLPGGTGNRSFASMLDAALNDRNAAGAPVRPIVLPEFGMSNVATPTPDWVAWSTLARDYAVANGIVAFCYWNNNDNTPRRYDFTAASDPTGNKLAGWHVIANGSVAWAS